MEKRKDITVWYIWNKKKEKYEYNHFDYGVSETDKPKSKVKELEKSWSGSKWEKKYKKIKEEYNCEVILE